MTAPATYSIETVTLTPTAGAHTTSLFATASSSIMTNYEPSRSVDSQHRIEAIEDINGNPIIFSVGTNNHLYAIVRSSTEKTGWAQ
ncbi:MAG: hypothetical protein V2J55_18355, partial [Candidatus Competibacteraceae bacterium]|nr:hypothetical protein [Candidatus Competibacteraceae bacterium]